MVTNTAKKVVASGFGSTPSSRRAVTHGPTKAVPAVKATAKKPATGPSQPRGGRPPARRPAAPSPGRARPTGGQRSAYRRPAPRGDVSPFGPRHGKVSIGSVRAQHILTAEMLMCLLAIALNDVMVNGTIEHVPLQGTAVVGLFLLLALASSLGNAGERIAIGFGGLVTLYVLLRRVKMIQNIQSQLTILFGNNLGPANPADPSAPGQSPGPPVTDATPPANYRLGGSDGHLLAAS